MLLILSDRNIRKQNNLLKSVWNIFSFETWKVIMTYPFLKNYFKKQSLFSWTIFKK